jgi:hypothetical protein
MMVSGVSGETDTNCGWFIMREDTVINYFQAKSVLNK